MNLILMLAIGCAHRQATVLTIDATKKTPISPYIYGANFPNWKEINVPFTLSRQGGNRLTAYNWTTNASNAGNDWHNQNDDLMGKSNEPGWAVKTFLQETQSHGAAALLTIQTAGYVAADKNGDGDVNKTPDYLNERFKRSYPKKPGKLVYPPDQKGNVYQDEQVAYIEKIKSPATPVWFCLDNEPDIWNGTHSRIWPKKPTYAQFIALSIDYASAIKDAAPESLIFGPVSYGWEGFRRFQDAPDANGRDFLDVYLSAMQDAEKRKGKRLLDVLDVHWYPEARGGDVRVTEASVKPETAEARIQAPRSLWDPTYVEASWITKSLGGRPIALLPGLQKQIADHYPGTKLSITEYNYGGNKDISGAIAQADVLGIFGRYGLFAACNWGISPADAGEIAGFRAFLNFDGKGGKFGDQGLSVTGESPASNSVYAASDSKDAHRLTLVVVNKGAAESQMDFKVNGINATSCRAYCVTSDSLAGGKLLRTDLSDGVVSLTAPGRSVTTVELKG